MSPPAGSAHPGSFTRRFTSSVFAGCLPGGVPAVTGTEDRATDTSRRQLDGDLGLGHGSPAPPFTRGDPEPDVAGAGRRRSHAELRAEPRSPGRPSSCRGHTRGTGHFPTMEHSLGDVFWALALSLERRFLSLCGHPAICFHPGLHKVRPEPPNL